MNAPYVPAPVGTIRGPLTVGHGSKAIAVPFQYAIQGPNGWCYSIHYCSYRARAQAQAIRAKILAKLPQAENVGAAQPAME